MDKNDNFDEDFYSNIGVIIHDQDQYEEKLEKVFQKRLFEIDKAQEEKWSKQENNVNIFKSNRLNLKHALKISGSGSNHDGSKSNVTSDDAFICEHVCKSSSNYSPQPQSHNVDGDNVDNRDNVSTSDSNFVNSSCNLGESLSQYSSKSTNDTNFFDTLNSNGKRKLRSKEKIAWSEVKVRVMSKNLTVDLRKNFSEDPELNCVSDYDESDYNVSDASSEYVDTYDEPLSDFSDSEHVKLKEKDQKTNSKFSKSRAIKYKKNLNYKSAKLKDLKYFDDGCDKTYAKRLKLLKFHQESIKEKSQQNLTEANEEDMLLENGLRIPWSIWTKLFKYQRAGIGWLWQLFLQSVGGIMGDEMGLGKTIQLISFLAALSYSKLTSTFTGEIGLGPVLILCPATIMHQWVKEFHQWWPLFRVGIFHDSGSYSGGKDVFISKMNKCECVLVTSYSSFIREKDIILNYDWYFVILDEGHMIRNPDAQITLAVKKLRTCHRIICSGSPLQNNLRELWSLFDFVYPGLLGPLPTFMQEFSIPITQGGYANATKVQVETAYRCACVLREMINPYLLRRTKIEVQATIDLPSKTEQILFCRLTDKQRSLYKDYLRSRECESILNGRLDAFVGLTILRKICNHSDLIDGGPNRFGDQNLESNPEFAYGHSCRSGKLLVVDSLLKLWKKQNHRVLMFSQSKQMLNILENFVMKQNYSYMRMDGGTLISSRQPMVKKFNEDASIFLFLLTTRVGGLGINLTGADRVIIFDPDWNPSTDQQARERAYRIGQYRHVTIYRLLTTGTIEEKIYHRQIFKQFLTNRVLKEPRQRRFFKVNDLYELFTLSDDKNLHGTETSALFADIDSSVKLCQPKTKIHKKKNADMVKKHNFFDTPTIETNSLINEKHNLDCNDTISSDAERTARLRLLAKKISSDIASKKYYKKNQKNNAVSINPKRNKAKMALNDSKKHFNNAIFEGIQVSNLDRIEERPIQLDSNVSCSKITDCDNKTSQQMHDDYVLQKLFKNCDILHSALQHDRIVNAGNTVDSAIINFEAERIASKAVRAIQAERDRTLPCSSNANLRKFSLSRKSRNNHSSAVTSVNDRKKESVFGCSQFVGARTCDWDCEIPYSAVELIKFVNARNFNSTVIDEHDSLEIAVETSSEMNQPIVYNERHKQLLMDLRTFIAFQANGDGTATTAQIISKFSSCVQFSESAVFKALLKQVATFNKGAGLLEGIWKIKDSTLF